MTADRSDPADPETPTTPADLEHWADESLSYDLLHERAAVIAELVVAARRATVFELGCSTGKLSDEITGRLDDVEYFGTDISAQALAGIRNGTVVQADLNTDGLPFAGQRFDAVVGSGILEYIDDLEGLFRELRSRLDTGGVLIVSYVNRRHVRRRLKRLVGRGSGDPTWRRLQTVPWLLRVASEAGFDDPRLYPVDGGLGATEPGAVARAIGRARDDFGVLASYTWPQVVIQWAAR